MKKEILVKEIKIPENVKIVFIGCNVFNFIGPIGSVTFNFNIILTVIIMENFIKISTYVDNLAILNTTNVLVKNIFYGIVRGYEKRLKLIGIGYKVIKKISFLYLSLGFSHNVVYKVPSDVNVDVFDGTIIIVKGFDKQRVGQVAAEIRSKKVPDVYKGKGIRYLNEIVILKAIGKKK